MARRTSTALATAAALAVVATAVVVGTGGDGGSGGLAGPAPSILGAPDGSVLAAGLETVGSCDDLGATMAELLEAHSDGRFGGGPIAFGRDVGGVDEMVDDMDASAEAGLGSGDGAADSVPAAPGSDGDATNVQEAGVDEPDVVERIGDLVLVGTQGQLRVVGVDAAGAPTLRGELALGLWTELELFAVGEDRAVALLRDGGSTPVRGAEDGALIMPSWATTTVVLVDLADPTAPRELSRVDLEGWLVDARAVDGVVRIAVRSDGPQVAPRFFDDAGLAELEQSFDWETATNEEMRAFEVRIENAYEQAYADAMAAVDGTDWQPHARVTGADGDSEIVPVLPCDRIAFPTSYAGMGTLTLTAIDATGDTLAIDGATAVVTGGEQLYSTADRVVIATTRWEPCCLEEPLPEEEPAPDVDPFFEEGDEDAAGATAVAAVLPMIDTSMPIDPFWPGGGGTTDLHVFDVDGTVVSHVASGDVDGTLLNQFSMSIHDGVLRTATTAYDDVDQRTESLVTTFRIEGDELVRLGQVGELGPNEDIQSVRFMGDVGYVVTFRRTDPLYVVDLADPTAPRTLGELKIEGYSAYLHPLGPGRLLGVGQDADPETGRVEGVQVSTFDVTNPTAPTRLDVDVTPGSHSEVEWDHHALTVTADGLVLVPFEAWGENGGEQRIGVLVYEVTDAGALTQVGTLDAGSQWELRPRRSVELAGVLVTVGEQGVITWDPSTFEPIDSLVFPEPDWEELEQRFQPENIIQD